MKLNGEQVDQVRLRAYMYVTTVLDFTRGSTAYDYVCKDFTPGYGTSCTFLPHWMLYGLGVSADNPTRGVGKNGKPGPIRNLINRNEINRGTQLVPGDGVAVLANSPAFVTMKPGVKARPECGDIVIIQSNPVKQSHEHVLVYLDTLDPKLWDTGESGQARSNDQNGVFEAKRKRRAIRDNGGSIVALASDGMPDRYLQGWLDLSELDYVPKLLG